MVKTLQQKIEELENQGWEYDDDFRMPTKQAGTLVQLCVMKKGNEYREINSKTKTICKIKKRMSEIDCERADISY
jgi:hypothetical protein